MASYVATASSNNIGGYDYDLVSNPPDRLTCKICHLPSRFPYLSVCCGHIFCKPCLDNVKTTSTISNACPVCRDEEFVTFPNKAVDREVKELQIYCTNKEKGCEWRGELNNIGNHLGECQFEEVKCYKECGKIIQQQYLTSHVETECPRREVNCQHCHDTGEHQFIEGQHKEECPKLPLPCPNKCEVVSILREDMEAHRKECPLEMIECEYYSVGCKRAKICRKDFEKHDSDNMKEHLMMTKSKLDEALKQIDDVAALVNAHLRPFQLDTMATTMTGVCPVTIKITDYKYRKTDRIYWYSSSFYSHNSGYKLCLSIDANGDRDYKGTHLSAFLYIMKGSYDDELTWPLIGEFEIKLLNQISDNEHHSKVIQLGDDRHGRVIESIRSIDGWGYPNYISNEDLQKSPSCQFLKNDCLFLQVHFKG